MCHREDVQTLMREFECLMRENAIIQKENHVLTSKLAAYISQVPPPCCADYGTDACKCIPGSNVSADMQRMLREMETISSELHSIRQERDNLARQQKLLFGCYHVPVCAPCITCAPGGPCTAGAFTGGTALQLLELREQMRRLSDDIVSKKTEIDCLLEQRDEINEEISNLYSETDALRKELLKKTDKLQQHERSMKRNSFSKEQLLEQQQQIAVFKQRLQQTRCEIVESENFMKCQQIQLEEYRNLYLETQQMVEEQRRQIEIMELDNTRISDQVEIEIQRVKTQFQERILELSPLPMILKQTQNQLATVNEEIRELENQISLQNEEIDQAKRNLANQEAAFEETKVSQNDESEEINELRAQVEEWENKYQDLENEIGNLREVLAKKEEEQLETEQSLEERNHEVAQLEGQLETVREESGRQVARTKDRLENTRRSLLCQIGEVERQLACARAAAKGAMKDRDEIRERMQCQINNLQGNFDEAQTRIRLLQQNVGMLSNSYNNIFNEISDPCPGMQALPSSANETLGVE